MLLKPLLNTILPLALLLAVVPPPALSAGFTGGLQVNGGTPCMACTILTGLLKQMMEVYSYNGTEAIDYYFAMWPDMWGEALEALKPLIKDLFADKLNSSDTPDVICYSMGICKLDAGYHYCHLWPVPEIGMEKAIEESRARLDIKPIFDDLPVICNLEALHDLCYYLDLVSIDMQAKDDGDGDTFSTLPIMRGYDWRGYDCGENNTDAYPGRIPVNSDRDYDSNCNGIFGVNPDTGNAYEDEMCGGQANHGIVYLGDSIGAHFHLPPDWFRANVVSAELMSNLTYIAGNELDWPHMSWGTGFVNSTWPVTINSPTNSLYWRMRNRNLCNHNDYQNLAFNGARSDSSMKQTVNITREEGRDKPVIVIYAEFGNDICRSDTGNIDDMTTAQLFHDSIVQNLDYMDTHLPYNSHVFLVGLVNGTYLYSILQGRLHPIGELNNDIRYDEVYNYMSCMQTVCPGWTNTNTTEEEIATDYAMMLSSVLVDIAATANYSRFDVHFMPTPLDQAVQQWTGPLWQLIEPVDGLHPSKYGQDLFAQVAWEMMSEYFPNVLGPENPNNGLIYQQFGDQGQHEVTQNYL